MSTIRIVTLFVILHALTWKSNYSTVPFTNLSLRILCAFCSDALLATTFLNCCLILCFFVYFVFNFELVTIVYASVIIVLLENTIWLEKCKIFIFQWVNQAIHGVLNCNKTFDSVEYVQIYISRNSFQLQRLCVLCKLTYKWVRTVCVIAE